MAYALAFTNTNSNTDVGVNPSSSSVTTAGSFLRFEIEFSDFDVEQRVYARSGTTQVSLIVRNANEITHRFSSTSASTFTLPFTLQINTRYVFEVRNGSPATVKINDFTVRSVSGDSGGLNWTHFGSGDAGFRPVRGKLYWIETSGASGALRFENLTGTGLELTEQNFSANPITLSGNWPSNNSQWVFYDDGGTANQSTVSYDLGAIDYAVSSQIAAPANAATVSYDIGAISYAVSAQQSAPQFSASVGYEIGGIGFAVQANTGAAIRTITALYDIGAIDWQVNSEWLPDDATAGIGYDIGEITFNSSVLNIPEGGFPSDPSKQYPNNPGWRYSVFFR